MAIFKLEYHIEGVYKMKYPITVCFFLLCLSCQKAAIDSFEITEKIVDYDSIYSDKDSPFNTITDMAVVDNLLITQQADDEYHFSLIDTENGKLIRRWGKAGRGPEEYIQVGSGFTIYKSQLVFLDATQKEINYIPLQDLTDKKEQIEIRKEPYPYTVDYRPIHIDMLKEQKIAVGYFKEGHFGILDSHNNIIANNFDYPFAYNDIQGINRGTVYQTRIKANIVQNKFVIQTLASDIFEIYEATGKEIRRIYISPFKHIPQIKNQGGRYGLNGNKSIIGLICTAVSDELICFTYSDEKYDNADKNGLASNEILCFNWKGEKVKKYILPFPVRSFCIDRHYIYGVTYEGEESIIYRFKLLFNV